MRVPLPAGLGHVAALELTPQSASGEAWLIDAHGWDKGLVPVVPARLGRIDTAFTSVDEGNSGSKTYNIAVTATGGGTRVFRLFYNGPDNTPATKLVTLKPGENRTEVPVTVVGNTRWGRDTSHPVAVQAISNAVVGSAVGGLMVRNVDAPPQLTVTPVADSVKEGGELKWKLTLSEAIDMTIGIRGSVVAPASGTELSTTDVDPQWFRDFSGEEPLPSRPLSSTRLRVFAIVLAGQTSAEFTVPTTADTEAEGEESVRLKFEPLVPGGAGFEVTGKVTDPA